MRRRKPSRPAPDAPPDVTSDAGVAVLENPPDVPQEAADSPPAASALDVLDGDTAEIERRLTGIVDELAHDRIPSTEDRQFARLAAPDIKERVLQRKAHIATEAHVMELQARIDALTVEATAAGEKSKEANAREQQLRADLTAAEEDARRLEYIARPKWQHLERLQNQLQQLKAALPAKGKELPPC